MFELDDLNNLVIFDSFLKTNSVINRSYHNVVAFISGGADSDRVVEILSHLDLNKRIRYVFFDTGLEYKATKDHLVYLENIYNIKIDVIKAIKSIPICCKEYGQPFISKQVSEWIERLQRNYFKWEDKSFCELIKEYPRCRAALRWWCNDWGEGSKFNIAYNKGLKEFMIANPPTFKISNKCCEYAKKLVAKRYKYEHNVDLSITGIRKSEKGARSTAYKNCFSDGITKGVSDEYRIIFWYKKYDCAVFDTYFNIMHSKCYSQYGLERTGCVGCPFGRDFEHELEIIQKYEPKLYKAVNIIFGESYEYTRKYKKWREEHEKTV